MLRTNVVPTVGPLSEASECAFVNLFDYRNPLLGLCHMTVHHAFQRLRVLRDEASVEVDDSTIDDEPERTGSEGDTTTIS